MNRNRISLYTRVPPKTLYSDWRAQIRPEPRGTQDSLWILVSICPHRRRNFLLTQEPGRAVEIALSVDRRRGHEPVSKPPKMNSWVSAAPGGYSEWFTSPTIRPRQSCRRHGKEAKKSSRLPWRKRTTRRRKPTGHSSQAPFVWSKWEVAT